MASTSTPAVGMQSTTCRLCDAGLDGAHDGVVFGPPPPPATDFFVAGRGFSEHSARQSDAWVGFTPPNRIPINHPWLSRLSPSAMLFLDGSMGGSNLVDTDTYETYGTSGTPVRFRIGAGKQAYTGILKALSERFINAHDANARIGRVRNHSRQTQIALLADVVQLSITDEPHNEQLAINERWCTKACELLYDHYILVGPVTNPAGLQPGSSLNEALERMISRGSGQYYNQMLFHSCGDGSATFYKKLQLWHAAGIDVSNVKWAKSYAQFPYDALRRAAHEDAYIMTERSTYLTAKDRGLVPRLRAYVEDGAELVVPCSVLISTKSDSPATRSARTFAQWLRSEDAQQLIRGFGRDWSYQRRLYTTTADEEYEPGERLTATL